MRNLLPFRAAPTATVAALATVVAAVAVSAGTATAPAAVNATAPTAVVKLVAADAETDLSTVVTTGSDLRYQGLTVRIPAAGEGVQAAAQSITGDISITVSRSADGAVLVKTDVHSEGPADELAEAQAVNATAIRPSAAKTCKDASYALSGWKLSGFKWFYNPAGAPASVRSSAASAIGAGTTALVKTCGQKKLKLVPSYGGATAAGVQVGAAGNCTGNDRRNVIGWRAGAGKWLGMTCTYFKTINGKKTVTGTDTALNTQYKFFTSTKNCSNAYDVQSVVLHERGHSLGLNHVSQAAHASAVMTPALSACSVGKRTLGLGDFRGLTKLYG